VRVVRARSLLSLLAAGYDRCLLSTVYGYGLRDPTLAPCTLLQGIINGLVRTVCVSPKPLAA
jgi:hypothetical protein